MAEEKSTAVATVQNLRAMMEKPEMLEKLQQVAPAHLNVPRVLLLMAAASKRVPKILQCTQASVYEFCMKCSETGLEPIGAGGAWPIPYGDQLTFIPDYRGLVNCAKHADCITDAYAEVVRELDEFDYELGLNPSLTHKPARGDRGELQAAYCVFTLPDGTKRFVVMDGNEVLGIKSRSKAASSGPWKTDEGEMWKKTVIRRAMKPFVGMNTHLDAAIDADDAAGKVIDVDPIPMPATTEPDEELPFTK